MDLGQIASWTVPLRARPFVGRTPWSGRVDAAGPRCPAYETYATSISATAVGHPFHPQSTCLECRPLGDRLIRSSRLLGAVAQLGERCVRNAEVGSSILLRSTERALLANTAGKALSLGIVMFSSLADCVACSSSSAGELTTNDTVGPVCQSVLQTLTAVAVSGLDLPRNFLTSTTSASESCVIGSCSFRLGRLSG